MGAALRLQPQFPATLNRSSKFAANALAIVSAAFDVNLATGKLLTATGSGYAKSVTSKGRATAFRSNFYLETEVLPALGTASFVDFWYGAPQNLLNKGGQGGGQSTIMGFGIGSKNNQAGLYFGGDSQSTPAWGAVYAGNWSSTNSAGEVLSIGVPVMLLAIRRQDRMELWRDGRLIATYMQTPGNVGATNLILGSFIEDTGYWPSSSDTILAGRVLTPSEPSAAEIQAFMANPWGELFNAPSPREARYSYVPAGGGAALSANVQSISAASGALTTGIALAGAPAARATTTGVLATSITLASNASAVSSVAGNLSSAINLAGVAAASASTTGNLSTAIGFSAAAAAVATASGNLSTAIGMAATMQSVATVTGSLLAGSGLSAVMQAGASVTGSLATAITMAGSAIARATASGALTTAIPLAANAQAVSLMSGTLAGTAVMLSAAVSTAVSVVGALATALPLSGAVRSVASITANLKTVLALRAALSSSATVQAALMTGPALIDVTKISPARIVVFEGSGSRVVKFDSSGSRVVVFDVPER